MFKYKENCYIAGFFSLCTGVLFGPLFAGFVLFPPNSDLSLYYYQVFDFLSKALHTGDSFLWMPHIFSGFPIYLSQVAGFFDPLNILIFSFLSGTIGVEVRLMIDVLLVFFVSYAAARSLNLSKSVSALVGPSYLLAFSWKYLSNPLILNSLFLLPFLIWISRRIAEGGKGVWRYVLLGGAGLGFGILGGYTQLVVYALLFAGLFFLGDLFLVRKERQIKIIFRSLGSFALLMLIGITIGLPQIIPAANFLPYTLRGDTPTYEQATLKVIEPGDLVLSFVPNYFYIPYITSGQKPLFAGPILTMLGWCSALALLFIFLRKRGLMEEDTKRHVLVAFLLLFAFVAAFKFSPLYLFISKLPVIGYFRFPFRFMFLGVFFLALLGAYGIDRAEILRKERIFRFLSYLYSFVALSFVLCITAFSFSSHLFPQSLRTFAHDIFTRFLSGRGGFTKDPAHYDSALGKALDAYRELLSLSDPKIFIPLLITAASAVVLVFYIRGTFSYSVFRRSALSGSAISVLIFYAFQWGGFLPSSVLAEQSIFSKVIPQAEKNMYRAYSFMVPAASRDFIPPQYKLSKEEERVMLDLYIAGGVPNHHTREGVLSVDGYDQFEPLSILEAMEKIGGELGAGYPSGTPEEKIAGLESRVKLLGLMGGKYIVSGVSLRHPDLVLISEEFVTELRIPLFVYRYDSAFPRWYLAKTAVAAPALSAEQIALKIHPSEVYLDCDSCGVVATKKGTLSIEEVKNARYAFSVDIPESQYVVFSESYLPGWRATIDGRDVPIVRANGLYMAVKVSPGRHFVTFAYRGLMNEAAVLETIGLVH